jgi:hypothetical protein
MSSISLPSHVVLTAQIIPRAAEVLSSPKYSSPLLHPPCSPEHSWFKSSS